MTSPFGAPGRPSFGTPSPFGTSAFGGTSSHFGAAARSPFGTLAPPEASASPFGAPSGFGGTMQFTPVSGYSSAPSFYGTTASPSSRTASTSLFGGSNSAIPGFGAFGSSTAPQPHRSPFGAQAFPTTSASAFSPFPPSSSFGTGSGSVFGSNQNVGTSRTCYAPTHEGDECFMSISAMEAYKDKSHEEIRFEDLNQQKNGGPPAHTIASGVPNSMSSPFIGGFGFAPGPSTEQNKFKGTDPSSYQREDKPQSDGCAACKCINQQRSTVGPTACTVQSSSSSQPFPPFFGAPTANTAPSSNVNQPAQLFEASTGVATLFPAFVNCVIPIFGALSLNNGGGGSVQVSGPQSLNIESSAALVGFPAIIPSAVAFVPLQPGNSVAGVPASSSLMQTSPNIVAASFQFPTSNFSGLHSTHLVSTSNSGSITPQFPSTTVENRGSVPDEQQRIPNGGVSGPSIRPSLFYSTAPATGSSSGGGIFDRGTPNPSAGQNVFGGNTTAPKNTSQFGCFAGFSKEPPSLRSTPSAPYLEPAASDVPSCSNTPPAFGFTPAQPTASFPLKPTQPPVSKGLDHIFENMGYNPWASSGQIKETADSRILPCEDASNDADIIALAEFAVQQYNAMDNKLFKIDFQRVVAACLEAVDGGRYHIVLEARGRSPSDYIKRCYALVSRKKTDRSVNLTVLEKFLPGL